jgi:hypothetical protein
MARLPRLRRDDRIVDGVVPSFEFQKDWQKFADAIEANDQRLNDLEAAIAVIQARLAAAAIP